MEGADTGCLLSAVARCLLIPVGRGGAQASARGYRTHAPLFHFADTWYNSLIYSFTDAYFCCVALLVVVSGRSMTVEEIVNSWNVQLEQDATTFTNEAVKV